MSDVDRLRRAEFERDRYREALENVREAMLHGDEPTAIRWLIEEALAGEQS
jgi:hypothetical protein